MSQNPEPQEPRYKNKPTFLQRLRDKAYDIVYSEGDFILQFTADFIRGPDPVRDDRHIQRQVKHWNGRTVKGQGATSPKPLTVEQQRIFAKILKRKPSESQVAYWKRKKALLQTVDKQGLVKRHLQSEKDVTKQQSQQSTPRPEYQSVTQTYGKADTQKQKASSKMRRS